MNAKSVYRDDRSLYRAATRRFGNWSKALRAAGLDPDTYRRHRVNRDRLQSSVKSDASPVTGLALWKHCDLTAPSNRSPLKGLEANVSKSHHLRCPAPHVAPTRYAAARQTSQTSTYMCDPNGI